MKKNVLSILLCCMLLLGLTAGAALAAPANDTVRIGFECEDGIEITYAEFEFVGEDGATATGSWMGTDLIAWVNGNGTFYITAYDDYTSEMYELTLEYTYRGGASFGATVWVGEGEPPEPPKEVEAKIKLLLEGSPMQNFTFGLRLDADGSTVRGTTNSDGIATFTLTKEGTYMVNLADSGYKFDASTKVDYTLEELGQGLITLNVLRKPVKTDIENITLIQNVYLKNENGVNELYWTRTTPGIKMKADTTHGYGAVPTEGLTECKSVTGTINGENLVFTWSNGSDGSPSVMIHTDNVTENSTITLNFYYEYIDGSVQYNLTVEHIFEKPGIEGGAVSIESSSTQLKANEAFEFLAQTSPDNLRIKKTGEAFTGYQTGTWSLAFVRVKGGGAENSFVGDFESQNGENHETYAVRDKMIHGNAVISFLYRYNPVMTQVSVSKVWDDVNDYDKIRPRQVTVNLLADGVPVEGKTVTLNQTNGWKSTLRELPMYELDNRIVYTFEEEPVQGYEATYRGNATAGIVITNKHVPTAISVPDDPDAVDSLPKTGDSANLMMWLALMLTGAAASCALWRRKALGR